MSEMSARLTASGSNGPDVISVLEHKEVLRKSLTEQKEKLTKEMHKLFKKYGLKIKVASNLSTVNFLDITFDLDSETHRPYRKPNDYPCFVHTQSNHPATCLRAIPEGVDHKLLKLSSNQRIFEEEAPMYQDALEKSSYSYKLEYKKPDEKKTKKRQRHRLILLFNPPFSNHVTTQIGKHFFEILDSSFPKKHPLHKIFNRSTVKLSFSTIRNIRSIVDAHNKKKMSQQEPKNEPCNCQRSKVCPMDRVPGGCQAHQDEPTMTYYGQTKRPFKERWREHRHAIENEQSPHATALSSYIWKLKKNRKRQVEHKMQGPSLSMWWKEMSPLPQGEIFHCFTRPQDTPECQIRNTP